MEWPGRRSGVVEAEVEANNSRDTDGDGWWRWQWTNNGFRRSHQHLVSRNSGGQSHCQSGLPISFQELDLDLDLDLDLEMELEWPCGTKNIIIMCLRPNNGSNNAPMINGANNCRPTGNNRQFPRFPPLFRDFSATRSSLISFVFLQLRWFSDSEARFASLTDWFIPATCSTLWNCKHS